MPHAVPSRPDIAAILNDSRDRFLSFLTRRVSSRETAEEILHAAFVKILTSNAAPRKEDRLEAWFYRILRNAVIDHYRSRGVEARGLEGFARIAESEGLDPDLDRAVCACIKDVIPALKTEYAEIIRRVELEERSLAEVSAEMGITLNNATVRLSRARGALRKRLAEVCGACTLHGCLSCACRPEPHAGKNSAAATVRKLPLGRLRE